MNKIDKSGFIDAPHVAWTIGPKEPPCHSTEHDPPRHIVIPSGKAYRHVCPSCGKVTILRHAMTIGR